MNCEDLIKQISEGKADAVLANLYAEKSALQNQKERYICALRAFCKNFGDFAAYAESSNVLNGVQIFSAPGRTEICGNHTDHQHGKCVAASINLDVLAVARASKSSVVNVLSEGYPLVSFDSSDLTLQEKEKGTLAALVKGVLQGVKNSVFLVGGFDCYITSNVIVGAGLSSSAAIENAVGCIVNHLFNGGKINPVQVAKFSKFSENVYFFKPCGLLDQMASSVGGLLCLDFLDFENPQYKKIDLDFSAFGYSLCIVDVKASHADLTADYAAIPEEMHSVAAYFGKDFLRQVAPADFYANIAKVRKVCSDRAVLRAFHFFEEETRVENLEKALQNNDFSGFLQNVEESGESSFKFLQNIYSPANPDKQNVAVALAFTQKFLKEQGNKAGVCRIHGGGFAGTIQVFIKNEFVEHYKQTIEQIFGNNSCHIMKIRSSGTVKVEF